MRNLNISYEIDSEYLIFNLFQSKYKLRNLRASQFPKNGKIYVGFSIFRIYFKFIMKLRKNKGQILGYGL